MYRLIKKLIVFAAFLISVRIVFLPFHTNEFEHKEREFNESEYTAVFIGSSRTKCAVIPAYFDQLLESATVSFNFGTDSALPPQTFDLGEKLMDAKPSLKYVFIELSGSAELVSRNEDRFYSSIIRYMAASNLRLMSENLDRFVLEIFKPALPKRDDNIVDFNAPCESPNGVRTPEAKKNMSETEIRDTFTRSSFLESRDPLGDEFPFPAEYWARITKFIEFAEARGISVRFFVPPRIESDEEMQKFLPLYHKLSKENKIENAHNDKSIYSSAGSRDNFHLNKHAALIFTRNLAGEFAKDDIDR